MNNFEFNYDDITPLNYKGKQGLNDDLDEILKNTINTTIDWKTRENSIKKLAQICIGDQGNSEELIKSLNGRLSKHLGIQMADLRSSVMKEACRVTSLCAKELGLLIEQGAIYLLTQYVLFKIAGSANRVISDSSSKCILNLVKYINSIKIITNICEQKSMKSNFVRNICSQCILYIMTCYKKNLIEKTNQILLDTMKSLLSDANGEVRATTRRAFITYRKRFEIEGDEFFENLEKNVQKQINEDEKKYGDSIIVDSEDGGEMNYENIKNKSNILYNNSNKSRSHEVKYNPKDNFNIDRANNTFQKELKNKEIDEQENDDNLYSKNLTNTTEFSDITQNDKKGNNNNIMNKSFKNKGNKSFKGKSGFSNYNNSKNSKTTKLNNKDLLKKLNDKFYNNNIQNSETNINNYIYSNNPKEISNDNDNDIDNNENESNNNNEQQPQIYAEPFSSTLNKNQNQKAKKNTNNQNNNDIKKNNNRNNYLQNNLNNININNYIQNNNNINDNFNINIDKDSMEYKLIEKINQLSLYNNTKEKLKIFQYLFNSFNEILNDVNNISDITLRQFVDIHIEYIVYEDKLLTEQIIKNLMRMIFYMTQIFTSDDIILIVKLLMMKINMGEKSVSKLSYELLDLIRKKWRIEDIYNGIFSLLEENKSEYNDVCYEYLTLLVIYCGTIFEDINYFRKIIGIICNGDMNSKKLGKLLEALNKNNQKNFIQTLKEQTIENQQKILFFMNNNNENFSQEIKPQTQLQNEQNKSNNYGKKKRLINPNKISSNSNNNASEEIKKYLENGNVKSFIDYIENNKSYLPNFLMLLSDEKYSNSVYTKNILNFIYSLVSTQNKLSDELAQNMEILVDQLIHFFLINIKNSLKVDVVKEILNLLPIKINSDYFYKSISKYLNKKSNVILLQALLICIKNSVVNNKSNHLERQLPFFINGVLDLLDHQMNDVRKYAIYCCVEIYMVLGHKFDNYLELLPKNQQNLINLFIKK